MKVKAKIIRHRKENLKKCSLRGLEPRPDFQFFTYPIKDVPDFSGSILLTLDAPVLTKEDAGHPLLLIDATWRYADKIAEVHYFDLKDCIKRSLPPGIQTAYPRKQEDCKEPTRGLASIEALYVAFKILGYETEGLLDHYYWKQAFIDKNPQL